MAASVRIEDEAFSDTRIEVLGAILGTSKFDALGRLAYVWRQATAVGKDTLPESVVSQLVSVDALVSAGLAVKTKKGVRIKGARGRIEWLERKRQAGRLNGHKGAEFGIRGGRPRKTPKKPGVGVQENPPPAPAPAPTEKIEDKDRAARPRNLLFDAIAEVTGFDPATAGGDIGRAAAALAKASYTPDEVREFGRRYWEICPYAANKSERPTPMELAKYIGRIRAAPLRRTPRPSKNGAHNREDELLAELRHAEGAP